MHFNGRGAHTHAQTPPISGTMSPNHQAQLHPTPQSMDIHCVAYFWVFVLIESLLVAFAEPLINFVMHFRCEFFGGVSKNREILGLAFNGFN